MILLDTNVVSEPLRSEPDPAVAAWLDAQTLETLYLSAVTVAEMRLGVALIPAGRRRTALSDRIERRVLPSFAGRVLPFDLACTHPYADVRATARAHGVALAHADGFIAAVAATHGLIVATRDTTPFEAAGLPVINPWGAPGSQRSS
ncbi:MAG: type II toxin-antitoxin system VapC family toxin [Micrococcales bacterium]|nr:type II toxin-antitoxin system VapC family toxin [Micrococcales bacterium]